MSFSVPGYSFTANSLGSFSAGGNHSMKSKIGRSLTLA